MSVGDLIRERRAADGRKLTPSQIAFHQAHKERQARLFPFKPKGYCPPLAPANDPAPAAPQFKEPWFKIISDKPALTPRNTVRDIQLLVCRYFDISLADMISERRQAKLVRPRMIAVYLCKLNTPLSLPKIGYRFGGRDHTTVLHSIAKISALRQSDMKLNGDIETISAAIRELHGEEPA